jgi:hypothetical protein
MRIDAVICSVHPDCQTAIDRAVFYRQVTLSCYSVFPWAGGYAVAHSVRGESYRAITVFVTI